MHNQTYKAHSWSSIESCYKNLIESGWDQQPILDLVRHIMNSELSKKLYAYTSLNTLVITIYEDIDRSTECLHVEFDKSLNVWKFNYYGGNTYDSNTLNGKQPEFKRIYNRDNGIEKFDQFIKWIKW